MKLKEIGVYFGIGESGVGQAGRRVEQRMKGFLIHTFGFDSFRRP
jgi:phosphoglycerate dehydrogenase-like enzyme